MHPLVPRFGHPIPFISWIFARRYKDARHPFHREFYAQAKEIDPILADEMDVCIIK